MTDESAIVVRGLVKDYGHHQGVAGVSFEVARGEVFALLGPNGAGKTTTVEILEGYRSATSGVVSVLGYDPSRGEPSFRERIGIVLQGSGVYPFTTPREVLRLFGGYYADPRDPDEVLAIVGLTPEADRRVRTLSGGQVRRLDVALAVIGRPQVIFLDEPTTGFDPSARRGAWDLIAGLAADGATVFLTTHYMEEAQRLADRVAVMRAGQIVAMGPPATLATQRRAEIRFLAPGGVDDDEIERVAGVAVRRQGDLVVLDVEEPTRPVHELTGWALRSGHGLERFEVARPSLEDVYLELTNGDTPA
jgi:ABC-2 type transport system ATP-binding protein